MAMLLLIYHRLWTHPAIIATIQAYHCRTNGLQPLLNQWLSTSEIAECTLVGLLAVTTYYYPFVTNHDIIIALILYQAIYLTSIKHYMTDC